MVMEKFIGFYQFKPKEIFGSDSILKVTATYFNREKMSDYDKQVLQKLAQMVENPVSDLEAFLNGKEPLTR